MKRKRRLTILLLGGFLLMSVIPSAAHGAWDHGNAGSAAFTSILYGKDGKEYYINENARTLFYNHNGTVKTKPGNGRSKVRWRYLKLTNKTSKAAKHGYCVEFGAGFKSAGGYKARGSAKDNLLFQNLSADTQKIIAAILCYGRNGVRKVPVPGINDADYYFATQVLIWEAQQKLRTMTKDKKGNYKGTKLAAAHSMSATHMQKFLRGRPAEKCYKWLVKKLNDHLKVHSFSATKLAAAPTYTLKESKNKSWTITLVDRNKKSGGIVLSNSHVSVKRSGYKYTFTSKKPLKKAIAINFKNSMKDGSAGNDILVWHSSVNSSYQAVIMGAKDLISERVKFKTVEKPTEVKPGQVIVKKKDQETGQMIALPGTTYKIIKSDTVVCEIKTDDTGKATLTQKLEPGEYQLEELKAPAGYRLNSEPVKFTIEDSAEMIEVEQKDLSQMGIIKIVKQGEIFKTKNNKVIAARDRLKGVTFDIVAAEDIVTGDGTIRVKKAAIADTIMTDQKGNAKSKELYLGKYNIVERGAPENYQLPKSNPLVHLKYAGQNVAVVKESLQVVNLLKKGRLEITKSDVSTGKLLPNTGIEILDADKKVILKDRTDKNGVVTFVKLPTGNYYFREFDAPVGYQIDESLFPFEIEENGQIVKCKMTNEKTDEASPRTGDSSPALLYLIAALSTIVAIVMVRKVRGMKY